MIWKWYEETSVSQSAPKLNAKIVGLKLMLVYSRYILYTTNLVLS